MWTNAVTKSGSVLVYLPERKRILAGSQLAKFSLRKAEDETLTTKSIACKVISVDACNIQHQVRVHVVKAPRVSGY